MHQNLKIDLISIKKDYDLSYSYKRDIELLFQNKGKAKIKSIEINIAPEYHGIIKIYIGDTKSQVGLINHMFSKKIPQNKTSTDFPFSFTEIIEIEDINEIEILLKYKDKEVIDIKQPVEVLLVHFEFEE